MTSAPGKIISHCSESALALAGEKQNVALSVLPQSEKSYSENTDRITQLEKHSQERRDSQAVSLALEMK